MVRAYLFDGEGAHDEVEIAPALEKLSDRRLLWVDVEGEEERGDACAALGLAKDVCAELDVDERPALRDTDEYFHLTVRSVRPGSDDVEVDVLHCVAGPNWLLTASERPLEFVESFRERVLGAGEIGHVDSPSFLATLLDWLLQTYLTVVDEIEGRLEKLDVEIISGGGQSSREAALAELVALRRHVGRLRAALAPHRQVFAALARPEFDKISSSESAQRFTELVAHLDHTLETVRGSRETVLGSFDVLIARTGQRTNDVMKILTLASIMLLPSSLLAGVMGMNFKAGIFDNASNFWVVVAVMIALALATVAIARVRRWI
jgi:magnesium/cobalt transport protein CorA